MNICNKNPLSLLKCNFLCFLLLQICYLLYECDQFLIFTVFFIENPDVELQLVNMTKISQILFWDSSVPVTKTRRTLVRKTDTLTRKNLKWTNTLLAFLTAVGDEENWLIILAPEHFRLHSGRRWWRAGLDSWTTVTESQLISLKTI